MFTFGQDEDFSQLLANCQKQVKFSKKRPVDDINFMRAFSLHTKRCIRRRKSDDKIEMITEQGLVILSNTECASRLAPYVQKLFEPECNNSRHWSFYRYIAQHAGKYLSFDMQDALDQMVQMPLAERIEWVRSYPHRERTLLPAPTKVGIIFSRKGRYFLDSPGILDVVSRSWCPFSRLSQPQPLAHKARRALWRSCKSVVGLEDIFKETVSRLDAILYNKIKLVRGSKVNMRKVQKDIRSIYGYLDRYSICFNFVHECLHGDKAWAVGHDVDGALIWLHDSYDGGSNMKEVACYLDLFSGIQACMLGPYEYGAHGEHRGNVQPLKPKETGGYHMIQGVFRRGHVEAIRIKFTTIHNSRDELDDSLLEVPSFPVPDHPYAPSSQKKKSYDPDDNFDGYVYNDLLEDCPDYGGGKYWTDHITVHRRVISSGASEYYMTDSE